MMPTTDNLPARLQRHRDTRAAREASQAELALLDEAIRDLSRQPHRPNMTAETLRVAAENAAEGGPEYLACVAPEFLSRVADELTDHWENAERWRGRLNSAFSERDYWEGIATRRTGLREELERELFGEVLPVQPDGGESVYLRALDVVRGLKAQVAELREAREELGRVRGALGAEIEVWEQATTASEVSARFAEEGQTDPYFAPIHLAEARVKRRVIERLRAAGFSAPAAQEGGS